MRMNAEEGRCDSTNSSLIELIHMLLDIIMHIFNGKAENLINIFR